MKLWRAGNENIPRNGQGNRQTFGYGGNAPFRIRRAVHRKLQAENAELRARLDKTVDLPFENLDKVFILAGEDPKAKQFIPVRIVEGTIVGFGYDVYEWTNGDYKFNYHVLVGENNYIFALEQFNKTLFKTRKAAEARLKELQGGER